MPHIHTQPGQHDLTVSAYIVRQEGSGWKGLVHMHKKLDKLLQVGGHVELTETPWQALEHELREECGYTFAELELLQPTAISFASSHYVVHPQPLVVMTHKFSEDHYHTDLSYGFIAESAPLQPPLEGESVDIRWLTLDDMQQVSASGDMIQDVCDTYRVLIRECVDVYTRQPAVNFSLKQPAVLPTDQA